MNKTYIFESFKAFQQRPDKSINGVSPAFAKLRTNWEIDNEVNMGCWDCNNCNGCNYCVDCNGCHYCWDCVDCFDCFDCSDCVDCSDCNNLRK